MAVPTIYVKLLKCFNEVLSREEKSRAKDVLKRDIRLMVSGSAALPQVKFLLFILENINSQIFATKI